MLNAEKAARRIRNARAMQRLVDDITRRVLAMELIVRWPALAASWRRELELVLAIARERGFKDVG